MKDLNRPKVVLFEQKQAKFLQQFPNGVQIRCDAL